MPHPRSRARYFAAIIGVIFAGLASRRFPNVLPDILGKYPGDALWALMVYLGWGFVMPRASIARVAMFGAATCLTIELLKLYQAPWIVNARHSAIGHLVFGHVFSWTNFVAYAVGLALGVLTEIFVSSLIERNPSQTHSRKR